MTSGLLNRYSHPVESARERGEMTDVQVIGGLLEYGALLVVAVWAGLFLFIFIDQLRRGR